MIYVTVYLFITLAVVNLAPHRLQMLWLLPWLALDCLASVVIRERFGATLSAKAWDARTHTWWHWTHGFVDFFFGAGHCQLQWMRERHYGGVWAAWAAQWRGETFTATPAELQAAGITTED